MTTPDPDVAVVFLFSFGAALLRKTNDGCSEFAIIPSFGKFVEDCQ